MYRKLLHALGCDAVCMYLLCFEAERLSACVVSMDMAVTKHSERFRWHILGHVWSLESWEFI